MALSIGIVGLPNVGKSTLFKAVTNKQVDIQNYPFTTIEPNVGVVEVPDERVEKLAELSKSAKKIHATIEFIDIAGLVKGASQGEGLGNKFLANIREVDAIAQVIRVFDAGDIIHVHDTVDPVRDIGIINAELIIADLDTVTKRLATTEAKARNDKDARAQIPQLQKIAEALQRGTLASQLELSDDELALTKELSLLTAKKFIYVINVSDSQLIAQWTPSAELISAMGGAEYVAMCNKLELELSELLPTEKNEYMGLLALPKPGVGGPESGLDRLIREAYHTLGLHSFLTTGPDETRAWTCHQGDLMPRASRAIHTDFERLFIRAEVINWKTLLEAGGYGVARQNGQVRVVGKDYVVQDGDVVEVLVGK